MQGRVEEVDFVRGIAILLVIIGHTMPTAVYNASLGAFHIGQAVPLFFFITFFFSFKGLSNNVGKNLLLYYYSGKRIKRVARDVILPFVVVAFIQKVMTTLRLLVGSGSSIDLMHGWLGQGPGSYYNWAYLQLWLLIPFIYATLDKLKFGWGILLVTCLVINALIDWLQITSVVYRLLCVRYLFLAVPAYVLLKCEKENQKKFSLPVIAGIIVSVVYLLLLQKVDLTPFILDLGWAEQQWPAYFWTYCFYIFLLWYAQRITGTKLVYLVAVVFGRNSWFIFLTQMFILAYVSIDSFRFITNDIERAVFFVVAITLVSVVPAFIVNELKNKFE